MEYVLINLLIARLLFKQKWASQYCFLWISDNSWVSIYLLLTLCLYLAENVAKQWNITRAEQDQFAVASQQKIAVAQQNGYFNEEIAPVTVTNRKGKAEPKSVRTSADLVTMTVDQQVMFCSHLYSHNSEEVSGAYWEFFFLSYQWFTNMYTRH